MNISVVIPLYNKASYIQRTLDSVLAQSFEDFECIVVDDGSTDCSSETVTSYLQHQKDDRIILIRQDNAGPAAARNTGIARAAGNIVAFLDADDVWTPRFLETIMRLRRNHPEAGLYATAFKVCGEDGNLRDIDLVGMPPSPWEGLLTSYFRSAALGEQLICSSAAAIPQKIFQKIGGFPADECHGEDLDLWCRIALRHPVAYSTEIGAIYYRNADNRLCRSIPEDLVMFKTVHEALKSNEVPEDMIKDLKEYIAKFQLIMAEQNYLGGNSHIAIKLLSECETSHFLSKKLWWFFWARIPRSLFFFTYKIYSKLNLKKIYIFIRGPYW